MKSGICACDVPSTNTNMTPFLHHDVLLLIMSFLRTRVDIFNLMRTCHSLYDSGHHIYLRLPIYVHEGCVESFRDYLLIEQRYRLLKAIYFRDVPSYVYLFDLLPLAVDLQVIVWETPSHESIHLPRMSNEEDRTSFGYVLSTSPTRRTPVELRRLQTSTLKTFRIYSDKSRMLDFLTILWLVPDSVLELTCLATSLSLNTILPTYTFPQLQTLIVTTNSFGLTIPRLSRLFPNLKNLSIHPSHLHGLSHSHYRDMIHSQRQEIETISWPSLQEARGHVYSLYTLGLKCNVPLLTIQWKWSDWPFAETMMLILLRDVRPYAMQFELQESDITRTNCFDLFLRDTGARSYLTHVKIGLYLNVTKDVTGFMNSIFRVLAKNLVLTYLEIHLIPPNGQDLPTAVEIEPAHLATLASGHFSQPTLRHVFVQLSPRVPGRLYDATRRDVQECRDQKERFELFQRPFYGQPEEMTSDAPRADCVLPAAAM
ncbi:hypothetical protein K474DRAFT_1412748 [Panus rudis PR-1116 ss-1]|nr:hypothetical protein K474DRAFT_1412748 [Panus rudis PR-1116 ss-1]